MAWRKYPDSNGHTISLYDNDGRMWFVPQPHFHTFTNMKSRDDDVLICEYPKSGVHWLWEIITMLTTGKVQLTTERTESYILMMSTPDFIEKLPGPRVLITHRQFHDLPSDWIIRRRKLVLLVRDAKDVCVSYFNLLRNFKVMEYEGTWDGFLSLFLGGHVPFNSWANWVLSFEKGLRENPEIPVHVVHYEKLKADTQGEIRKLSEFLGTRSSLAQAIAEETEFKKMKQFKESAPNPYSGLYKDGVDVMFRHGDGGQGKQWFTEEQAANFDKVLMERMGRSFVQPQL